MRHISQRGFSTIELFLVVVIVAIFTITALVQYQSVGQGSRLNSEVFVGVGLLRDMQNKALSPRRPAGIPEVDKVCGYMMFSSSGAEALTYYAIHGNRDTSNVCANVNTTCSSDSCGGNLTATQIDEEPLKYSVAEVSEKIFVQVPFSYTYLGGSGSKSETSITFTHQDNSSLTRQVQITRGGFITSQTP